MWKDSPFRPQDNRIFTSPHSKKYLGKQFHTSQSVIFSIKYWSFKFCSLLNSSSTKADEGTSSENVSKKQFFVNAIWIIYNCLYSQHIDDESFHF